jgi:lipid-A-disaccharide synthase-like uncharacterized protein
MILALLGLNEERLRKIPILGKLVDERFINHRQRAARVSWIAGCVVAIALFSYRYFVNHVESRDLLVVILTMAGFFIALMAWYLITD